MRTQIELRLALLLISGSVSSAGEPLQDSITRAYQAGQRKIVILPGTYRIIPPGHGSHLQFRGMSDFEIDATGARLVFEDQTRGGIEFRDCRNVRFHGASIAYAIPPFTQGVVTAIAPDGKWYDIEIDTGYPADLDNPAHFPAGPIGYLFDRRTRLWKPGSYDLYGERAERLSPNRFRVHWNRPSGPALHPVALGDLMAFRGSGQHNITVLNCQQISFVDVTITNAGNFAVWEFDGEGGNRYSFALKPGPPPPGATTSPLLSSTADAFHSTNVRRGPILEGCDFEGMADDGIAIQGTFSFVFESKGSALIVNHNTFRRGDRLRLFNREGSPAGEAMVKAVRALKNFQNTRKSGRTTLADPTQGPYTEIALDRALPAAFDDLASNASASGSGYQVLNNTIRNHRGRGMLLKADNGLVRGNTIEGSSMGGIVLTPEFWWNEASYSQNTRIVNNTIRHVAYAPMQLGGVVVAALDDKPIPGCGHRNIILEGNRFEDLNGVNLLITSACDVTVRNNQFINPGHDPGAVGGTSWGENPEALIFVSEARSVRFGGNTIHALGPFTRRLVDIMPTAFAEGSLGGVKLK